MSDYIPQNNSSLAQRDRYWNMRAAVTAGIKDAQEQTCVPNISTTGDTPDGVVRPKHAQKWTARFVQDVYFDYGWEGVVNDHRAALAAERERYIEREKTFRKVQAEWAEKYRMASERLAAETAEANELSEMVENYRRLLLAERKKVETLGRLLERVRKSP